MFNFGSDEDEIQSERDFFYAIAFESIDPALARSWIDYDCAIDLSFKNIHEILAEFDDHTLGRYNPESMEIFVAQQIWISKCAEDRFANPEFSAFLKLSNLTNWAYAGKN